MTIKFQMMYDTAGLHEDDIIEGLSVVLEAIRLSEQRCSNAAKSGHCAAETVIRKFRQAIMRGMREGE